MKIKGGKANLWLILLCVAVCAAILAGVLIVKSRLSASRNAQADRFPELSQQQMMEQSSLVVYGVIKERSEAFEIQPVSGKETLTHYDWTLEIQDTYRGEAASKSITVRTAQDLAAYLHAGDAVFVFLHQPGIGGAYNTQGDYYYLTNGIQGLYCINEADGSVNSLLRDQPMDKNNFIGALEEYTVQYPLNPDGYKEAYIKNLEQELSGKELEEALAELEMYATILN